MQGAPNDKVMKVFSRPGQNLHREGECVDQVACCTAGLKHVCTWL